MKWLTTWHILNKFRRTLRQSYRMLKRKAKTLSPANKEHLQFLITNLQAAINQKDIETGRSLSRSLEEASSRLMPKTLFDHIRDLSSALLFALVVAIAIRQMWFELYTIPSGSMRPTLKEDDLLLVSKTDFGINTITRTSHLLFDPTLVQRGEIVVFSVENMDVSDPDTTYFLVIPGKKQYVKRLIGKPGDTLYFYGGQIYGIDAAGQDLPELRDSEWALPLEHIPFIRFDGKPETPQVPVKGIFSPVIFYQMNEPIAKLTLQDNGKAAGEMLLAIKSYSETWGFQHYAMARVLTPAQVKQLHPTESHDLESAPLYLELTHHPSLQNAKISRDEYHRLRPELSTSVSLLALDETRIDQLMRRMITCRFVVKDGLATRFGTPFIPSTSLPRLKNIPDGTYEIQDGKAYRVLWSGITYSLSNDHPLLSREAQNVQLLYNLGIEWDEHYAPAGPLFPSRYAYFRDHGLYLLGHRLFETGDNSLLLFLKREHQKQAASSSYQPFEEMGPPMKNGQIDADFIRKYGIQVPEHMYLVLGDNHAMSADSRYFGFVPQDNLRGSPSLLVWPPGSRWGRLLQPAISHLAAPNVIVWTIFLMITLASTIYIRRKYSRPLF